MRIQNSVLLAPYTTFRVGGPARLFAQAATEPDVVEALQWAAERDIRAEVIGGGSNLLIPDSGFDGLVIHLAMRGVERSGALFDVAAGEPWDTFVDLAVSADCAGVECLAGIPGSAGATPVQNVGAYGQEVAQTIESVRAFDRHTARFLEMTAAECAFRYRRSRFNTEQRDRYVITRVRFRLHPGGAPFLGYADLRRWFADKEGLPTLAEVAAAVRAIRSRKGMVLAAEDPDTWSAGSFFKNPVVEVSSLDKIAGAAGVDTVDVPHWPADGSCVKLSAAWLLERAGFSKGFRVGAAGLSTKHALALTNRGGAKCEDILRLEEVIRSGVCERFGVVLEREPVMLGGNSRQL